MELRQLRYFLAVVDHGSFSSAAESLYIAQPSLSVSVRKLEEQVGVPLLARGPRGVSLTPLGATFAVYARSIVRQSEKALDEIRIARKLKRGRVTVGISAVFSSFLAPEAIDLVTRAHAEIEIVTDVSTHQRDTVVARLTEGAWDFGVLTTVSLQTLPDSLSASHLMHFKSGIYVSTDHPLARREVVRPEDLNEFDWIAGSWNLTSALLEREFTRHGLLCPRIVMVSNSFGLLRELVSRSPFVCLLPDAFAALHVAAGRLIRIDQDFLVLNNAASIVHPAAVPLTPAAAKLMEAFRVVAAQTSTSRG